MLRPWQGGVTANAGPRACEVGGVSLRRFLVRLRSALGCPAAALVVLAVLAGSPAFAADVVARLNSRSNAQTCENSAARGDSSDTALAACDRAISREHLDGRNLIATLMNRGNIHVLRNEGAAALQDFDAVIALDEADAAAWLNRGVALMMLDSAGQAVIATTEALSLGVSEPHKAYYTRAAAREALGDLRGAYEDYSTALEIEPDWGPADAELQRLVRRRHEWLAAMLPAEN